MKSPEVVVQRRMLLAATAMINLDLKVEGAGPRSMMSRQRLLGG
jgi:hypothetical protein